MQQFRLDRCSQLLSQSTGAALIAVMFYKYNQTAGKIQASEGGLAAQVNKHVKTSLQITPIIHTQAAAPTSAQVTHIPAYKVGSGGESDLSRIKALQAFFKVKCVHRIRCTWACLSHQSSSRHSLTIFFGAVILVS